MSSSSHVVCDVVFGNVYFVKVFFIIHGRKRRFSETSQNPISGKSIFGHFEVIFSQRIKFSQGGDGVFLLVLLNKSILTKR